MDEYGVEQRLMPVMLKRCCLRIVAPLLGLVLLTGCASKPWPASRMQAEKTALRDLVLKLDASVDNQEAASLADTAMEQSAVLAREFRAVRPASLGNYLVNLGWRDRGLCYDWANALFPRLHELGLRTLELHLAVANMDTKHEHNCIVVTAQRQALAEGVVLDAWRHSGRLWFGKVSADKYPWQSLPQDRVPPELKKLIEP